MNLKDMVPHLPDGMTDVKEILLQTADIPWREKSLGKNAVARGK